MHLRAGAWGKKIIAKLPYLSRCVEAISLTHIPRKGETPLRGGNAAEEPHALNEAEQSS